MLFHRQLLKPKSFLGLNMFVETGDIRCDGPEIFNIDSTRMKAEILKHQNSHCCRHCWAVVLPTFLLF